MATLRPLLRKWYGKSRSWSDYSSPINSRGRYTTRVSQTRRSRPMEMYQSKSLLDDGGESGRRSPNPWITSHLKVIEAQERRGPGGVVEISPLAPLTPVHTAHESSYTAEGSLTSGQKSPVSSKAALYRAHG